jgi:CMP-N,N'-diacetyllegionaminic acid synthase
MLGDKNILCVVTARGGSVGLPGKNYRKFVLKPLFIWSVLAALQSKYIDLVIVSSNCPHVEKDCKEFKEWFSHCKRTKISINPFDDKFSNFELSVGNARNNVKFLKRPEEFATAVSKNEDALIHALDYCSEKGIDFDIVMNLQPTSPIRQKTLIDSALEEMINGGYDSALTVSEHTPFFIKKNTDNSLEWFYDPKNRPMRQEILPSEMMLHDDGCLYIVKTDILLKNHCRIGKNPFIKINDSFSSYQIDTEQDFLIVEKIKKEIEKTNKYI